MASFFVFVVGSPLIKGSGDDSDHSVHPRDYFTLVPGSAGVSAEPSLTIIYRLLF